jgi:hypothetical protein
MSITENMQWKKIEVSGSQPNARADHVAFTAGSQMFVFGGSDANNTYYNDMWVLDTGN